MPVIKYCKQCHLSFALPYPSKPQKFCSVTCARRFQKNEEAVLWWKDNYKRAKKWCRAGEHWVDPSLFYKSKSNPDKRATTCAECTKKATRAWREENKQRFDDNARARKYGITPEEFERLKKKQKGRCAICRKIPKRALDVDHCHKRGHVRGLLCGNCNTALGLLYDDPKITRRLLSYLVDR